MGQVLKILRWLYFGTFGCNKVQDLHEDLNRIYKISDSMKIDTEYKIVKLH
jgi:hypothetical protein